MEDFRDYQPPKQDLKKVELTFKSEPVQLPEQMKVEVINPTLLPEVLKTEIVNPATKMDVKIVNIEELPKAEKVVFPAVQDVNVINQTDNNGLIKAIEALGDFLKAVLMQLKPAEVQKVSTDIPVQRAGKKTDPKDYVPVRLTNGKEFYEAITSTMSTVASAPAEKIWLREEYTWTTVSGLQVPTRIVRYDHIYKVTEDIAYDSAGNAITKTRKVESRSA